MKWENGFQAPKKAMGIAGKIFLTIFVLLWAGLPATMLVTELPDLIGGFKARGWRETPCTILSSEARPEKSSFRLDVKYAYSFDGGSFESSRFNYSGDSRKFSKISERAPLLEKYGKGKSGICFVNPANPSEAILERPGWGGVAPVAIPLVFVVVGVAILVNTWRGRKPRRRPSAPPSYAPGTPVKPWARLDAPWIPLVFGGIFLGIGIFIGSLLLRKFIADAGSWASTEGTVISTAIRVTHGKHGSSSSPYVSYSYSVNGLEYENDDFSTFNISSSSRDAGGRLAPYRPGGKATVYYKPGNPAHSVLEVRTSPLDYLILIFPLLFVLVGGGVFLGCLKGMLGDGAAREEEYAVVAGLKLKRQMGDFGGKLIFAVIWNLFCLMFVSIWFRESGNFSWTRAFWTFDKFFVLVFPLVGVGLIVSCLVTAARRLAVAGHYEVVVAADRLVPGARVQVNYVFKGNAGRLPWVAFSVVQRDMGVRTSSRGGVGESSAASCEKEDDVWDTDNPLQAGAGSFVFTLPEAINSPRIDWSLKVRYGKLSDTFKLPVAKAGPGMA